MIRISIPCWRGAALVTSLSLVSFAADAHHGRGEFFNQPTGEVEGEVVDVQWRSPHVMITVRGPAADGSEALWVLEGSDAGTLARRGLTDEHELPRSVSRVPDALIFLETDRGSS